MFSSRRIVQALVAAALSAGLVLGSSTNAMAGPCGGEGDWAITRKQPRSRSRGINCSPPKLTGPPLRERAGSASPSRMKRGKR